MKEKVIIFGTGEFAKNAFHFYQEQDKFEIIAFSDNDKSKQDSLFFGIQVIAPENINTLIFDQILVASSFDNEILAQLLDLNIDEYKIKKLNISHVKNQLGHGLTLQMAEELMINIAQLFNKKSIDYHIDHGTLLGIIRDNSLMPWDIDVDFACKSEDQIKILAILNSYLNKYQSNFCKNNNWVCRIYNCDIKMKDNIKSLPMVIKIFNDTVDDVSNGFFLDIELKYLLNKDLYWMIGSRKLSVKNNLCFPSKYIFYKTHKLSIPHDVNQYLTLLYGDWKITIKDWSYDQYSNIVR